jgi:SAM-dependent methyltransferase
LTAFDISDDMLSKAYTKLNRYKNIKLLNQNMIDFKLKDKYESIVSLCDSINYILKEEDLSKVFENVYEHLEKNGIFIFDINSYYKLKNIIGNNIFVEDREDIYYIWQNEYEEDRDISNFYLTFFCSEDGHTFRRFDETHRERAYKIENVKKLLLDSGFKIVDVYEGFTFETPKDESERINFIAIK